MRVRIKFSKTDSAILIGHLDVMRYFQKALRRAGVPVLLSGGFHPHMLMSFAAPLGVGVASRAEYFDLELEEGLRSVEIVNKLNEQMTDGFSVLSAVRIPEDKYSKGMSLVAAADYAVTLRKDCPLRLDAVKEAAQDLMAQSHVLVLRASKKGEREVDIRPWIYSMEFVGEKLRLRLSAGSVHNLKPETVLMELCRRAQKQISLTDLQVERREIYAEGAAGTWISLEQLGEEIV